MKRLLLFPLCSLFALFSLNSCQKEDKTALELTEELTAELKTVCDHDSAEKAAPKIKKLNDRCRRARITLLALNQTALARTYESKDRYVQASIELAREIGRVRASKPALQGEDAINEESVLVSVGYEDSEGSGKTREALIAAGTKHIQNETDNAFDNPPALGECYNSAALVEALAFNPEAGSDLPDPEAEAEEAPAEEKTATSDKETPTPAAQEEASDETTEEASDSSSAESEESIPAVDDSESVEEVGGGDTEEEPAIIVDGEDEI